MVTKQASQVQPDIYEAVFGALAHPARRRVLLTIYFNGGAMTAGEIAAMFAHTWQTTTRHVQVLEAAGLLAHERLGRLRIYRLQRKRLATVSEWLAHFQRNTKHQTGVKHVIKGKGKAKYRANIKGRVA